MKKVHFIWLVALAFAFVIVSCSKDEGNNNDNPNDNSGGLISAGFWKTSSATISPQISLGGFMTSDYMMMIPPCMKDDLRKFDVDGTIIKDEGETKCDPEDPQTKDEGTWVMSEDEKVLTASYPGMDPISYNIIKLNETTLICDYMMVADFGEGDMEYTVKMAFELQ